MKRLSVKLDLGAERNEAAAKAGDCVAMGRTERDAAALKAGDCGATDRLEREGAQVPPDARPKNAVLPRADFILTRSLPATESRHLAEAGFSLMEMIIVIALAALMFVVAAPSFTLTEETEAAQKLGALAGDIRTAYDTAVLTKKPHRLVFSFGNGDYWLESTERTDFLMGDEKLDRDPTPTEIQDRKAVFEDEFEQYKLLAGKEVEDPEEERVIKPTSPLMAAKDRLAPVEWKAVEDAEWSLRKLGPQFGIRSMQAEHHGRLQTAEELGEEGFAYLYFFPQGYVERAVIHISPADPDDRERYDERTYTLITEPYEGLADISSGFREVDITRDEKAR